MKKLTKLQKALVTIAVIFLVMGLYSFLSGDISLLFFIVPLGIIVLLWIFSKGKWEIKLDKEDSSKWKKSTIFNFYLILFIFHSLFNLYFWIVRPSYTSDELEFSRLLYLGALDLVGFILLINFLFIIFLMRKKAPKQILSIPLISIINFIIPGIIPFWSIAMKSYVFAILPVLQIIWTIYVRFIFLKER